MKRLLYILLSIFSIIIGFSLSSCTKEIDFDYHDTAPLVIVEGRVSNEGMSVVITRSRNMNDSVKGRCLPGAVVTITSEGEAEQLVYDATANSYRSTKAGVVGQTYHLSVDFEDCHYEATSQMLPPAPISSAEFLWMSILEERLLAYEVWAVDPKPGERTHYLYRMDRHSSHPHLEGFSKTEPYRWSVFDDRGCPPGKVFVDVFCMSERAADEDKEDDWEDLLYEGDTITFSLMTIDRDVFEYFTSLRAGQSGGANPRSNITGGCQGYFAAMSITAADTLVYRPLPPK